MHYIIHSARCHLNTGSVLKELCDAGEMFAIKSGNYIIQTRPQKLLNINKAKQMIVATHISDEKKWHN